MSGASPRGRVIAGAAALAIERVNQEKALLPGRLVHYTWADSGCSTKQGLAAMGELQSSTPHAVMTFGILEHFRTLLT